MIQTKTIALSPVAKPAIVILIAATVGIITSASIVSMASARGHRTNASGTIASMQNDKNGNPAWILSGDWNFRNVNTNPAFNSIFHMMMLNGSDTYHKRL